MVTVLLFVVVVILFSSWSLIDIGFGQYNTVQLTNHDQLTKICLNSNSKYFSCIVV